MNYNELLEESNNANIQYTDLIKPAKVWRIKKTYRYRGSYSAIYLSFSFVMEKNLKFPELGFNLLLNRSLNQRPICFINEQDAKQFYDIYKNKETNLKIESLEIANGRGGNDLVRISKDGSIPVYGTKSSVEYLLKYEDNKVPEYVKNRLYGEVSISDEQKVKDLKKKKQEDNWSIFIKNYFDALKELPLKKVEDKFNIENNPLAHIRFNPIIDIWANKDIEGNPINIYFKFTVNNKKSIVCDFIKIENNYIFDKDLITVFSKTSSLDVFLDCKDDNPARLIIYLNNNNCDIINYKKLTLSPTLSKDEIKKSINNYIEKLFDFIKNLLEDTEI